MAGMADWGAIREHNREMVYRKEQYERQEKGRLASVTYAAHSIAYPATPFDPLRRLVEVNAPRREARLIPPKPTALGGISPSVSSEILSHPILTTRTRMDSA